MMQFTFMQWLRGKKLFLINRDFQLRYVRSAVMVGLCSTVLTVFLLLFPLFRLQILRFPNFVPFPFLLAIIAASVLNFVIVALMSILMTHRIAGPMFAVVRHIHILQSGKLRPGLRVRADDDLKYLIRNFNGFVEFLMEQNKQDQQRASAVVSALRGGDTTAALALAEGLQAEVAGRVSADVVMAGEGGRT